MNFNSSSTTNWMYSLSRPQTATRLKMVNTCTSSSQRKLQTSGFSGHPRHSGHPGNLLYLNSFEFDENRHLWHVDHCCYCSAAAPQWSTPLQISRAKTLGMLRPWVFAPRNLLPLTIEWISTYLTWSILWFRETTEPCKLLLFNGGLTNRIDCKYLPIQLYFDAAQLPAVSRTSDSLPSV